MITLWSLYDHFMYLHVISYVPLPDFSITKARRLDFEAQKSNWTQHGWPSHSARNAKLGQNIQHSTGPERILIWLSRVFIFQNFWSHPMSNKWLSTWLISINGEWWRVIFMVVLNNWGRRKIRQLKLLLYETSPKFKGLRAAKGLTSWGRKKCVIFFRENNVRKR